MTETVIKESWGNSLTFCDAKDGISILAQSEVGNMLRGLPTTEIFFSLKSEPDRERMRLMVDILINKLREGT